MNDLINMVVSQLGVNEQQATGGLGSIMKLAQEHLGTDFSHIEKYLPEVQKLISQAPQIGAVDQQSLYIQQECRHALHIHHLQD
jgi:hypothetical protein